MNVIINFGDRKNESSLNFSQMIRIHERVGWSKKIYRRWPVTFSPRSPSDPARLRVITRGSKRHFSSAQYFFLTRLLLIHTAYSPSPSLSLSLLPLSDSLHPPRHRYYPFPFPWVRAVGRGRAYFVPFPGWMQF